MAERGIEIFNPPSQDRIKQIESWESVPGEDGMHPENVREDPVAAAEAIKQLVDLGYVEAPDENVEKQVAKTVNSMKYNQAVALTYSRRRGEAIGLWQELIEQAENPKIEQGYKLELATCLMRMGRHEEVEKLVYSFGPKGLEMPAIQMMLATIRLHQERGEEALKHLQSAASKMPEKNPQLVAQLGQAYLQTYQLDKAYEQFELALADDDENAIACFGLAELSNLRGQHERALEYSLRAIELADAVPAGHYHLAFALSRLNLVDEAILALETFHQLAPTAKKGRKLLEELYEKQGGDQSSGRKALSTDRISKLATTRLKRYLEDDSSS